MGDGKSCHLCQNIVACVRSLLASNRHRSPISDRRPIASKQSTLLSCKQSVSDRLQSPDRQGIRNDKSHHLSKKVIAYERLFFASDRHWSPVSDQRLIANKRSTLFSSKRSTHNRLQALDQQGICDDKSHPPCQKVVTYVSFFCKRSTQIAYKRTTKDRRPIASKQSTLIAYKRSTPDWQERGDDKSCHLYQNVIACIRSLLASIRHWSLVSD